MPRRPANLIPDHLPPLPRRRSTPIGCIGAGFIMADCQLVAYRAAGLNPLAICSAHADHAAAVAARHDIPRVYASADELLDDREIQVVDIAVPPDVQIEIVRKIERRRHIRGVLLQKPLGVNFAEALEIHRMLRRAGIVAVVNQNMRYDHAVRASKSLLESGILGEPVFATIDMRAVPHWMPWQKRQGWVTLRIMSIHHLDTFRYWFGDPVRIYASTRTDPRTAVEFRHIDGICTYILEYAGGLRACGWDDVWAGPALEGAAADNRILFRIEGTTGMARGTIGWPGYPNHCPSTVDYTAVPLGSAWVQPRWKEAWFPDAFIGPMAELLIALERGSPPPTSTAENLKTMALVDAAYLSAKKHRAVALREISGRRR